MNNERAFPMSTSDGYSQDGMTLRDWFAGQIASSTRSSATGLGTIPSEERKAFFLQVAEISYEFADALLAVRERAP